MDVTGFWIRMKSSISSLVSSAVHTNGTVCTFPSGLSSRNAPSLSSQPTGVQWARRASRRSTSRIVTPYISFVPGWRSSTRKKRLSELRTHRWSRDCRCRGAWPRIFTRSTSSPRSFSTGSTSSWKSPAPIAAAIPRPMIGTLTR